MAVKPGSNLMAKYNSGKPQLGDIMMKAVRPVFAISEVLYL